MLSIIIPTLNEEKVLERTLKHLRELRLVQYEIIVSDGRSSDKTLEIARRLADKVVVYQGQARQTIGQGKNLGAEAAVGEYLVFIDADIFIPEVKEFFAKAVSLFENNARLAGLTVFLQVFPEDATFFDRIFFAIANRLFQIQNNFLRIGAAAGEFQMVRAEVFRQLGGYNQTMAVGEDTDFFARLSKIARTWAESSLRVFHTSRRAHSLGWAKLLRLWLVNFVYVKIFKKSFSREWTVIR